MEWGLPKIRVGKIPPIKSVKFNNLNALDFFLGYSMGDLILQAVLFIYYVSNEN